MKLKAILILVAIIGLPWMAFGQFGGGDGSQGNPYIISTVAHWNALSSNVQSGNSYSGKFFKMTADIGTVTTRVGTVKKTSLNIYAVDKVFSGTFDGGGFTLTVNLSSDNMSGNAPFRCVQGATIKNLVVVGTVNAAKDNQNYNRHASGLVGFAGNTNTSILIENCKVKATVGTSGNGTDYLGGIVGHGYDSQVILRGCVYEGNINATKGGMVGGLIGWANAPQAKLNVENCFFNGSVTWNGSSGNQNFHPIGGCEKKDPPNNLTYSVTNSYYLKDMSGSPTTEFTNSGKHAYSIKGATNVTVDNRGTASNYNVYNASSITSYSTGVKYNGVLYGGNADVVSLSLSYLGYSVSRYNADHGTLSGSGITGYNDQYNLTMQAYNTVISATSPVQKFHIANVSSNTQMTLEEFASAVNWGTTYSGQTVYVDEDIANTTVAVVAGTSSKPFQGTFEGNKHTINFTCTVDVVDKGLLGYVSGAGTIQNVFVNATLSGTSTSVGIVVGSFASTGTICNVEGSGTISGSATHIGGLVGDMRSGMLHSSFAVATLNGTATNKGGLVGKNTGNVYNSYSNVTYGGTATTYGGLIGSNSGNVENCYAAGITSGVSALAGSNNGTIQYCYADAVGNGYVGSSSTAPSGCGLYGTVQTNTKHLNYMYRDNLIVKNTNTYVGSKDAITDGISVYVANHIPVWNGLVSALNQWVRSNPRSISGLTPWYRPLTTAINGDLPVLGFSGETTLGAVYGSPKALKYGSMDELLTAYNGGTASIFHYGKATGVAKVPSANVNVFIAEDAVLLQATNPAPGAFTNTTVGVTFDNSNRRAYDYWGNQLNYDWHFLSTPLNNPLTGAEHSSYNPSGNASSDVDITAIGGYFPSGLPMALHDPDWKWDFYSYYEPAYHWINLKRNKKNHYHQDGGANILYNEADQDLGDHSAHLIPGKGYMMAISQDTYMNATGTLNHGSVSITLTNREPDDINYAKGWNLVGNPYQAYLNINQLNRDLYIYDADQGIYIPYTPSASSNPATPSQYIHPHQAFFVHAGSDGEELEFTQDMASTDANQYSYYRDEQPNYPLVNIYAENSAGQRDLAVIEFHRPDVGGALKFDAMRNAPFTLAAHHVNTSYGILFATDELERVPIYFKADEDDEMTLTWSTHNGVFTKLQLVDNITGVTCDMLDHDSYSFFTHSTDYSSRFYITYECSATGVEENEDSSASAGSAAFAYVSNGSIVIGNDMDQSVSLQIIDMVGHVLYSTVFSDSVHTVSTSRLAKGVYLIRLANGLNVKTQKLVVQ